MPSRPVFVSWDKSSSSVSFTVSSNTTNLLYQLNGASAIQCQNITSPQRIDLPSFNVTYSLILIARDNAGGVSSPSDATSISIPSLSRSAVLSAPLYLSQLDTSEEFGTITSGATILPSDTTFDAVLTGSADLTRVMSNAWRFAVQQSVLQHAENFEYDQLLFYQADSSEVSDFFENKKKIDITQGILSGNTITVSQDYIETLAYFFFNNRSADVLFNNGPQATAALADAVAAALAAKLMDSTVYSEVTNPTTFETDANVALLFFKAIVNSDANCFTSVSSANALRSFVHTDGQTYLEYGLPLMAGDSFIIHLTVNPSPTQLVGQTWTSKTSADGTIQSNTYKIKVVLA